MIISGIDPGTGKASPGGIAVLDTTGARMIIFDMPVFEYETTRIKRKVDPYSVARLMRQYGVETSFIEEVFSSPQMSPKSAFTFGEGFGTLVGIQATLRIPTNFVKPQKWKRDLHAPADKSASVMRAVQLFPAFEAEFYGPKGGLRDGRAEAAMIALYGALHSGYPPASAVQPWQN